MSTATSVKNALKQHASPEKAEFFPRFFKSGKGEYGEGDKFLGVIVPRQREVAKTFRDLPFAQTKRLLQDSIHECRLTALLILVNQFERSKDEDRRGEIVEFYLANLDYVNNWDLVDSSAHKILGAWLLDREDDRYILDELAESEHLWRERVSVIACFAFIRRNDFDWILRLAEWFLDHEHDLIHKAVGWMLREMGKREEAVLHAFLTEHYQAMPRTMLRYAIEKLPEPVRRAYLNGRV